MMPALFLKVAFDDVLVERHVSPLRREIGRSQVQWGGVAGGPIPLVSVHSLAGPPRRAHDCFRYLASMTWSGRTWQEPSTTEPPSDVSGLIPTPADR
jgi:hypothetical protein